MASIRREITAIFVATVVVAQGAACSSHDIVLGQRGVIVTPFDPSSSSADTASGSMAGVGSGGSTNVSAGNSSTSGAPASAAGTGGSSGTMAIGGAPATPADAAVTQMVDAVDSGIAARASGGCGLDPPASDTSIQVGAMTASYIVDIPQGYDKRRAYPLIMGFRGAGVSAEAFRGYLDLVSAVGADAIVVNANCLNNAPVWDVQRDLPLFDALLAKLEASYCIDPQRVFAAGHGSGAFFVSELGCVRGDALRGIAPLSGGPPAEACQGQPAVWISQGSTDPAAATGRADRDFWIARSKCDATMFVPVFPDPCMEFQGCDSGASVRYCEYNGGLDLPDFAAIGLWAFFKGL